jgi:hypothetical protein
MLKNLPGSGEILRGITDNPKHQIFYDSITNITENYTEIDIPIFAKKMDSQFFDCHLKGAHLSTNVLIHYMPPEFIPDYLFSKFSILYDLQIWFWMKERLQSFLHPETDDVSAHIVHPDTDDVSAHIETNYSFKSKLYKKTISVSDLLVNLSGVEEEYKRLSVDAKDHLHQNIVEDIRFGRIKKYGSVKKFYMSLAILYLNFDRPDIFNWELKAFAWLARVIDLNYEADPLNRVYINKRGCVDQGEGIDHTPVINIKKCGKYTPIQLKSISKYLLSTGKDMMIIGYNKRLENVLKSIMVPIFSPTHLDLDQSGSEFVGIKDELILTFKHVEVNNGVDEFFIVDKIQTLRDSGKVLPGWNDEKSFFSDLDDIVVHTELKSLIPSFVETQLNEAKETARLIGRELREQAAADSERELLLELETSEPIRPRKNVTSRRGRHGRSVGKDESFTPPVSVTPPTTFIPASDQGYEQSCKYPFSEGKQEDVDNNLMRWLRQSFSHYKLDRRVTRWRNRDPNIIRTFKDKNAFKYNQLSDHEIYMKRLYHHLPGTDLLLNNKAYSFDTPTGKGLIVTILRDGYQDNGVIYFGIGSDGIVFHRFFEPPDDDIKQIMGHTYPILKGELNDNEWECNDLYVISIDDEGIVLIHYPDENYEVRVYPVREDLIPFQ